MTAGSRSMSAGPKQIDGPANQFDADTLALLRCPVTGDRLALSEDGTRLVGSQHSYDLSEEGIPLFAAEFCSDDAKAQSDHYDKVADQYIENLSYPHTIEYMSFLDDVFFASLQDGELGTVAEICCGRGEAFELLKHRLSRGVGVDVSVNMLRAALDEHREPHLQFLQGDATMLPLAGASFDNVVMLGGIHHVRDRQALFNEVFRILKPGGRFYFREPVSDLFLWRLLRDIIYRLSPALDYETERPLLHSETVPPLEKAGLSCEYWKTHGALGFMLFMNSDVLVFNRLFRFLPGIRTLTRAFTRLDEAILRLPGLAGAGLQVVGVARKPEA